MLSEETAKAKRLARAIASDISLYNPEKIVTGLMQDNFFVILAPELEEGRRLYISRVPRELDGAALYYWQAIVDVVFPAHAQLDTPIW